MTSDRQKDTTGNIFSILIARGTIAPEITVSPIEVGQFEVYEDYENEAPIGGVNGRAEDNRSIWDPNFRATPKSPFYNTGTNTQDETSAPDDFLEKYVGVGNFSYAHIPPFGRRKSQWANTIDALQPMLSFRGPAYELGAASGDDVEPWDLLPTEDETGDGETPLGTTSITLTASGSREQWSGNVGFNDVHVEDYSRPDPDEIIWSFKGLEAQNVNQPDNIFVNEDDINREPVEEPQSEVQLSGDQNNSNGFLRSYYEVNTGGGETSISVYYD